MEMIGRINCEPYGYIKHEMDELNTMSINEAEDIKVQEVKHKDVNKTKESTFSIPTNIVLDNFHNHDNIDFSD